MRNKFNLKRDMEYIKIDLDEKSFKIKVLGSVDNPYFCGKDVCELLQFLDAEQALQTYVVSDDKKTFQELVLISNPKFKNISHNEGEEKYITESGVYALLLQSPVKFNKAYRKLICSSLSVSKLKNGEKNTKKLKYNIKNERRRDLREEIITFFKLHTNLCIFKNYK